MKKSNAWSAIVIWMWLTVLIMLTAIVILDYIVPFARSTAWWENSSNAFYQSMAWVEESLYFVKNKNFTSTWKILSWNNANYKKDLWYNIIATWSTIPLSWSWTSDFDKNFNIIWPWYPVQLQIWSWAISDFDKFNLYFKVPDFASGTTLSLSWWTTSIISWILTSENDTLNADSSSWSNLIQTGAINSSTWTLSSYSIKDKFWMDLSWSWKTFNSFYSSNCTLSWCTLKLNVISDLEACTQAPVKCSKIPYLEYKLTATWMTLPQQYTTIDASWKSYWYKNNLKAKVQQQTTIEWFDFTLFQ